MGDKLINPIVGILYANSRFPWDDHPPNLDSVHGKCPRCRLRDEIDSFEEKALADICHRGNSVDFAGWKKRFTVYISLHLYGIVSGYFTRCLLLF